MIPWWWAFIALVLGELLCLGVMMLCAGLEPTYYAEPDDAEYLSLVEK